MEIKVHIGPQDWIRFRLFHLLHSPGTRSRCLAWIGLPPVVASGALFGLLAWLAPAPVRFVTSGLPALLVLPLCVALFLHVQKRRLAHELRRRLQQPNQPSPLGEFRVGLSEEGVSFGHEAGGSRLPWAQILRVRASADYGYLYTSPEEALIIPRLCFPDEESFQMFVKMAVIYHFNQEHGAAAAPAAAPPAPEAELPPLTPLQLSKS